MSLYLVELPENLNEEFLRRALMKQKVVAKSIVHLTGPLKEIIDSMISLVVDLTQQMRDIANDSIREHEYNSRHNQYD